jgi:DNA repair protein RecN (Recombination protein N)
MLLSLRIENFALVDSLELQLGAGLSILTGETGAGKSIILDAIDAALGGKVTSRMVRTGAERALVEATFQMDDELRAYLEQHRIPLPEGNVLLCSREIVANQGSQRNRSRVNGMLVNRQQMEVLRDRLVEITAQGQTVQLGHPPLQREWLDSYGGEDILHPRKQVVTAFMAYQQAAQALDKRRKSEQERLQQLDLFEYQLRELNAAHLTEPDELEQLEQERNRLSHSVELQQHSYQIYQTLYENESGEACLDLLGRAESILQDMVVYDSEIQSILDLVSGALEQVEDAGRQINLYGENLEADPQRLEQVQQRIVELKQICRKYGPTLTEAIALQQRLQAEMLELTGGGQSLEELEHALQERQVVLAQECAQLTHLRQIAAKDLEERLIAELKPLAMEKVQFQVELLPCAPSAYGADQVRFLFSPNPGEPLQPLTEIASGGEMSRFLLALQAAFSRIDPVGTLVFDEIDVGVSGRVTQAIAEKLYQLSRHHQVLCVTHQPIVAAMADYHFRVSKHVIDATANGNGGKAKGKRQKAKEEIPTASPQASHLPVSISSDTVRTVVRVTSLDAGERREELAQLAGGQTMQEAIAFADSLLAQAATLRQDHSPSPTPPTDAAPQPPAKAGRSRTSRR